MIKKFKLGKDAFILSVMTLITALSWVGFEVYRAATKSTISRATKEQLAPLNPKIERGTLNNLKDGLSFEEEELNIVVLPPTEEELNIEIEEELIEAEGTGSSQ